MANKEIQHENEGTSSAETCGTPFEIRVKGHLDQSWSKWLEGLDVKLLDNGEMVLFGHIRDQAALIVLLNRLYRLNLALLSLNEAKERKL